MKKQIPSIILVLCCAALLLSGCAAGISRTGYQLPAGTKTKDLQQCRMVIQNNAHFNTNDVVVLGAIHAYDTSVSIHCDEATVLDIFCREACMLGADVINITEEKQPNFWTSSCYRARAQFLRLKDREKASHLVSDPQYTPDLIVERSVNATHRIKDAFVATVFGGPLAGIIVWSTTGPKNSSNTNSVPSKVEKKP